MSFQVTNLWSGKKFNVTGEEELKMSHLLNEVDNNTKIGIKIGIKVLFMESGTEL